MPERNGLSLRPFSPEDLAAVLRLFHDTVHTVNATHYSPRQLEAWAPMQPDESAWLTRLSSTASYVVEQGGTIVGFGNLAEDGRIDTLYVGSRAQKKGVGAALLARLLAEASTRHRSSVFTEASITARPFFEKHGFRTEQEQMKVRNGESFVTYLMRRTMEEPVEAEGDEEDQD